MALAFIRFGFLAGVSLRPPVAQFLVVRPSMFASILTTTDGDFDYGAAVGSLIFVVIIGIEVWILLGALQRGRIPFGAGRWGSPICWLEREKRPAGFWLLFSVYCLFMGFCLFTIWAFCTGFFHKPV